MINSRRKGHDFERLVVKELRFLYPGARRGLQSRGEEVPDVDGTPWWIECKKGTARYVNERRAYKQACENTDGRPPVAICRVDGGPITITMSLGTFKRILQEERCTRR